MEKDNLYKRQASIVDRTKLDIPIHIIGVGGIGSWSALLLAKMGCTDITLYDDDVVEEHNVASQFFSVDDLGKKKIEATKDALVKYADREVKIKSNEHEKDIKKGVVIMAVDSMEVRKELGELFEARDLFIIDGRMGGLQAEIYNRKAGEYLDTIVESPDEESCTAKAISFNCAYISSMIANSLRAYVSGEKIGDFKYLFEFNKILYEKV